ncbi:hybrid sensor histidine kinase/response regulator [Anaeromyxobacter paludicola]|uniref:histidine kinase n=1 Tax=Anaeromyxobacter paludicola TaxID=2918171 RepID=A0ABN6N6K8_9BACT|nr:response regulator [Anaeromyxobacter paludicola]BDG08801.1 hybrid sensor histidine kinase/response regulator [Anaeromyxobacter paludicola]
MSRDPYRYFRIEARELVEGLSRGLLALERAPADRALVSTLLRQAHTLKGAARVVKQQELGELAHGLEEALAPHREEGAPPVPRERVDAALALLDRISSGVAALAPAPPAPAAVPAAPSASPSPPPSPAPGAGEEAAAPAAEAGAPAAEPVRPDEAFQSLRVDVQELDALLASVLEAGVQATGLRRQLGRLDHAGEVARALQDQLSGPRGEGPVAARRLAPLVDELRRALGEAQRALTARAEQVEREVRTVRVAADRLRLLPARALFGPLTRAARDAARTLGREVDLEASGGEVRVDANVLAAARDALLHVVRNAVAHGIEPGPARLAAGKPSRGRITLEVERRGGRVLFRCRDDGRGLDLPGVRAAAEAKGLLGPGAPPLDEPAAVELLLRGGLSTSPGVNAVAGRGLGLDVVRDVAARLKAELGVRSAPGAGLTVELLVPVSITAMVALRLQAGGADASLPLDAVEETLWLPADRVVRRGEGRGISHRGQVIPFLPLADVLRRPEPASRRRAWSAVVVRVGGARLALGAERLAGTAEVVVRPLPACVGAEPAVAGAALDAEGTPVLALDPAGLLVAAGERPAAEPAPAPAPLPILVVDDSLTTRMLEQSILESAGYEVELAVSAEEGLEKARARRYGLFLVDVEMPGMDGFEFVRVTRADPRTAATPAILVTSRSAPEDRRRGMDAGAAGYVVKGDFDQGRLLAAIQELVG